MKKAQYILEEAKQCLAQRGVDYDSELGEQSMGKIVKAFNAASRHELSEKEGWLFMVMLKAVRCLSSDKSDSFMDGAAYFALAGESVKSKQCGSSCKIHEINEKGML